MGHSVDLPLVGSERWAMADELVELFDRVVEDREPRWLSIEAGIGWGKTRLAHELYRVLASERQASGRYWPPTMLDGVEGTGLARRSRGRGRASPYRTRQSTRV